ncbi:hypothetical protein GCM10028796_46950 [Ramlibacter monticola]
MRIPLRTVSAPNVREHHMARARRVKRERFAVGMVLNTVKEVPSVPCVVLLQRVGPYGRKLDDDNLRGAMKAARDEVARWLGCDDGDERIRWVYAQERSRNWGVVVMCESDDADEVLQ